MTPDFFKYFSTNLGDADPRIIVARLISLALGFMGIIFLVMILAGGLAYMTSGGNEEKIKGAKRTFINAIIGIIIILTAYSTVYFVVNTITTTDNSTPSLTSTSNTQNVVISTKNNIN